MVFNPEPAKAQQIFETITNEDRRISSRGNERLLLDADTLTFDQNRDVVTVSGDVQIFFDGQSLEADQVIYDRKEGTLKAKGRVRLIDQSGVLVRGEDVTLSEDFKNAFITGLQLDGPDDTFFAANSAERKDGKITILKQGVYNVCGACQEQPGRIPTWRIKAQEIIIDEETHKISYKNASFEILGVPVAYLPRFSHTDPRIKQKTGILAPSFRNDSDLGIGVGLPVYYAFTKSSDVTVTPTGYTNQGLLGQLEFRQRLSNGAYTVELAGIRQESPEEFLGESGNRDNRGGLRTTGNFAINEEWNAGWDILALSDRNFAEDYDILTDRTDRFKSNAFLTGLSRDKYFDARGLYFNILDDDVPGEGNLQNQQAFVHPSIDYEGIIDQALAGGQVTYKTNFTSLSRLDEEVTTINGVDFLDGASGSSARGSAEVEWKRQFITNSGHVITPSVAAQGDILSFSRNETTFTGIAGEDVVSRGQITAGLEWRYPILFTNGSKSHIFEPIAQIFASPSERKINEFINEDSQNLLLDDTNIFSRNRFNGFDRVEGGVRANVGFSTQSQLTNWLTASTLVGQSFHLAGDNSFAQQGVASVQIENGLQTKRSDLVARAGITAIDIFGLDARGRFDEEDFNLNRTDIIASFVGNNLQARAGYTFIREQPLDDVEQSSQVFGQFALKTHEYITFFGDGRYDLDDSRFVNNRIGIQYDDNQVRVGFAFRQDFDTDGNRDGEGVELNVNFRTLGGF